MKSRVGAFVVVSLMLVSLLGMVTDIGTTVVSAEVDDEISWKYGQVGTGGSGANQLFAPTAAHLLDNGSILITDQGNNRVIEVDVNGNIDWQYGTTGVSGSGFNQLGTPAFEAQRLSNGNTLITDSENHRIIEVDPQKQIVWQYGTTGSPTPIFNPRDAERLANGNTLVADTDHRRIIEVDSSKTIVWELTNVQLPTDADRLTDGNTLISEPDGYRVFEVDTLKQVVWE